MAHIRSVATCLPEHTYSSQQILDAALGWLKDDAAARRFFERLHPNSEIGSRHFAFPLEQVMGLNSVCERAAMFERSAPALAESSIKAACRAAEIPPSSISTVITTSCSVPIIPALDTLLLEPLGFLPSVRRLPIYQHGCGAGAAGLALANSLCRPDQPVLLVSVELCSLVYQRSDLAPGNILGSLLFGDGAAAAVVDANAGPLLFVDSRSHFIAGSRELLGYALREDGNHVLLGKDLPVMVARHLPALVGSMLKSHGLSTSDIRWWLLHPGGARVLRLVEEVLGIRREQSRWAWEVLKDCGNVSSAAVLFVLERFLAERAHRQDDYVLLLGIGPGIQLEAVLLQVQ